MCVSLYFTREEHRDTNAKRETERGGGSKEIEKAEIEEGAALGSIAHVYAT